MTATVSQQLRRRREASQRLPRLDCNCCCDPLTNRHRPGPAPRGYRLAAGHLHDVGLLPAPPDCVETLRAMWKAGDRQLAETIATAWEMTR